MFFREKQRRADGAPRDEGGIRPSPGLDDLLAALARRPQPTRILDLAPVDEASLLFLAEQGYEVQVAALAPDPDGKVDLPDYPEGRFDGILAWDYLIRLDAANRGRLADALQRWLAPGGEMLVILPIATHGPGSLYRFRIRGVGRLEYRSQGPASGESGLPTRDVLALFPQLEGSGARVLRQGAREFLLRRPPEEPPPPEMPEGFDPVL